MFLGILRQFLSYSLILWLPVFHSELKAPFFSVENDESCLLNPIRRGGKLNEYITDIVSKQAWKLILIW